jgi:hypothetical protein
MRRNAMLAEAAIALVAARLAVRLVPAARLLSWAKRAPKHPQRFADPDLPTLVAQAAATAASWPWINAACLPQALAVQAILRRRGIASLLCLGVARDGRQLAAHAWIEIGHKTIIGESRRSFVRLPQPG